MKDNIYKMSQQKSLTEPETTYVGIWKQKGKRGSWTPVLDMTIDNELAQKLKLEGNRLQTAMGEIEFPRW